MDNDVKQGVCILTMFILFSASIAGIGGLMSRQIHQQQMEIYNAVSKCRQQAQISSLFDSQSPQNVGAICGPLPKFQ